MPQGRKKRETNVGDISNVLLDFENMKISLEILKKAVLEHITKTSSGKRTLASDLLSPLTSKIKINNRLELVDFFYNNFNFLQEDFIIYFENIPDIARSLSRLSLSRGGPRDFSRSQFLIVERFLECPTYRDVGRRHRCYRTGKHPNTRRIVRG